MGTMKAKWREEMEAIEKLDLKEREYEMDEPIIAEECYEDGYNQVYMDELNAYASFSNTLYNG